jgi:hypothetical protein
VSRNKHEFTVPKWLNHIQRFLTAKNGKYLSEDLDRKWLQKFKDDVLKRDVAL